MTRTAAEQAAEALRNSTILIKSLTGLDDEIAIATVDGNNEALAALTAEAARARDPDEIIGDAIAKANPAKWEDVPARVSPDNLPMTGAQIKQWIDACNYEPARNVLRHYLWLVSVPSPTVSPDREALANDCDGCAMGCADDYHAKTFRDAAALLRRPSSPSPAVGELQPRVAEWMATCFGPEISADRIERNHRFIEEALELVQAGGCTKSEAHQLVDYVYDRPQGDINQEVGGVMVTLAALCLANGFDMHRAVEIELDRVWRNIDKIRAKQAAKPRHSPLPESPAVGEWRPTHRHYKGGLYRVIACGRIEADLTPCVVYDNDRGETWVRSERDFNSIMAGGGLRFTPFVPAPPQETKP